MKNLEDEIEDLEKLDRLRVRSATMRDEGRAALRGVKEWGPEFETDDALIVKALCDRDQGPPPQRVKRLEILKQNRKEEESVPVLRAARSIQALAAAPDSAFSEALLYFYYQVVRELYTADMPDWSVGGARADTGGSASAFVTGECVRAILGFSRTLKYTSLFVDEVRSLLERQKHLEDLGRLMQCSCSHWCSIELRRRKEDFRTTVVRLLDNIALRLGEPEGKDVLAFDYAALDQFIEKASGRIRQAVDETVRTFKRVIKQVRSRRDEERKEYKREARESAKHQPLGGFFSASQRQRRYERSQIGHDMAFRALERGRNLAERAQQQLSPSIDCITALGALKKLFERASEEVKGLIHPSRSYLSTVLDRELAMAAEARTLWDPAEMVFAAVSYGFANGSFEDDRLRRAGLFLSKELSERGRFRSGNPFHVTDTGNRFEVSGANVLGAFAQLLENVETIPVDEDLVRRMIFFFEDTRKTFRNDPQHYGWCHERAPEPAKPVPSITAASVLALDRINRMLDSRINTLVFRHFSVKKDLAIPPLRKLFYPDYGLRPHQGWENEEPVALVLEKMRRHVLGLSRREKGTAPLFSLILHGPPGTGKTTFAEALAKSASVPLVEVTPSDIVSSGADVVERRARAVFKALTFLTRAVVLFDEFDPVLKRRKITEATPTVFSFVTPGMLPKLKDLHEKGKVRSTAYILITNLIVVLDGAAVRPGRFDRRLGIYPPDPLSRQGRLLDEALSFFSAPRPTHLADRVREVVRKSGGAQMERLTREGWFRRPVDSRPIPRSVFEYLGGTAESPPDVEGPEGGPRKPDTSEADPEAAAVAELEYLQMQWLERWEEQIRAATAGAGLMAAIENPPEESSPPAEIR